MITNLEDTVEKLRQEVANEALNIHDLKSLEAFRIKYLGEKSFLVNEQKNIKNISPEDRPLYGKLLNELKIYLNKIYDENKSIIDALVLEEKLSKEAFDITLPGIVQEIGHEHPLSMVTKEIVDIFHGMGFTAIEGPELETDFYNFTALNTPPEHPARDEQDTFYTNISPHVLLRSHTSTVQIRAMEKMCPPLRVLAHGRVYRNEEINARKMPFFHQLEILAVEKNLTFGNMKWVLNEFIKKFFGKDIKVRFRPDFFPFTEPSAELDSQCPFCEGSGCTTCGNRGWLELLGCGMVDPNVLKAVDIDSNEWIGFAAGLGLERFTMLKYKIPDIRYFFTGDLRFLKQF